MIEEAENAEKLGQLVREELLIKLNSDKVLEIRDEGLLNAIVINDTVGRLFSRTAIFADFVIFLFYTKIVSPKYNIYARINHNNISGGPC